MKKNQFTVLLYYKYVTIKDPQLVRDQQRELCEKLQLKGRIIIANEGINGTVEGTTTNTKKYCKEMQNYPYFKGISFKTSIGSGSAFPKLSVKYRTEVVTTKTNYINPQIVTGKYITAEELHDWFEEKKEFYIVDMRNDYEYQSGYFENFIPSGIHNFYDLADVLPRIEHLKNKTVVTVCTGGIRCEKASGYLLSNGFNDVYQLKDGIVTYMEKYPNRHFKGKLYVFDNRLTIGFNTDSPDHEIVGNCMHCKNPCDSYVNCEYDMCHFHYICCTNCKDSETGLAFCKKICKQNYQKYQLPKGISM